MPDPKLQAIMEEIKPILRKHNVAGLVILASPTHMEHLLELDPPWTCFQYDPDKGFLRVRCKAADYPSRDAQRTVLEASVGTLVGFHDVITKVSSNLDQVLLKIHQSGVLFDHRTTDESN